MATLAAKAAPWAAKATPWVVQLQEGTNIDQFARNHGLLYKGPLKSLASEGYHLFESLPTNKRSVQHMDRALEADNQALWAERQVARKQYTRAAGDPLYSQQWHLHGNQAASMHTERDTHTGRGVTIGIVDDGLQTGHAEIRANWDRVNSYDFNDHDTDPNPRPGSGHGTSAAAVAAGVENNGHCGKGVAPGAKIVGLRTIGGPVTDYEESMALSHAPDIVDIYSCSWGPYDSGDDMQGPGHLTQTVLANMAGKQRGRMGKGSIYVWASGNGRENKDSCAYDGYAGSEYVLAIGAVNHVGVRSWYSEGCANLFAVAPSSGAGRGIVTADLQGSDGYEYGECTSHFGGTSSATPAAAGAIARILEKHPEFTVRDVKHVIAKGATHMLADKECKNAAPGTPCHSNAYGFGLLRFPELMRAADAHQLVPPERVALSGRTSGSPFGQRETTIRILMQHCPLSTIEHVVLDISLRFARRGDVTIVLLSPNGTRSVLATQHPDSHRDYPMGGWSFSSVHFWGQQQCQGTWQLKVHNAGLSRAGGRVDWVQLKVKGY